MLEITIPSMDFFDESKEEFITTKEQVLKLEHSLVSISKWESKWKVPFLDKKEKTREQMIDYIKYMTLTQNVDPLIYEYLPEKALREIKDYIDDPMTASWFSDDDTKQHNHQIITSELIYYWMIQLNVPVEFQKWHLNRLMTLIRTCNVNNAPPKKMSKSEILRRNKQRNEERKARLHTNG